MTIFDGFREVELRVGDADVRIHARVGGSGPPVLLLHGFPQTHAMWHPIAEHLAGHHTVVAPDLRGYGDSERPPSEESHAPYSFRAMAADQVALMSELGHERFAVVGHDRGARVGHRMGLDHPDAVTRLAMLDIVPTRHVYAHVGREVAEGYYHWFLFIQPFDLPERLVAGDPMHYLHQLLGGWGSGLEAFTPEALAEYERCFDDPEARHAMFEDYRAAASIDLVHDDADAAAGRLLGMPVLVLWGARGVVVRSVQDPLEVWREYARDVRGSALDGGHFLVEELPRETFVELERFLRS